jgi:hypothetical protein
MCLGRSSVYKGNVEFRLNATSFLELAEESAFIRRDGSERCLESIDDRGLWKVDGNIFERLWLLGNLRLLLLGNNQQPQKPCFS